MDGNSMGGADTTGAGRFDRRRFLGFGAVALTGAGAVVIAGRNGAAHDEHGEMEGTPEASPQASPSASPVAGGDEYMLNAIDLAFEPNALTIPAGTDVTIRFENLGAIPHDFAVDQLGVKSALLSGGESTTVTINASPGTYAFHCSVPGHKQAGMRGTLTVE
jgi:nitrite reductase (NO-forming)